MVASSMSMLVATNNNETMVADNPACMATGKEGWFVINGQCC